MCDSYCGHSLPSHPHHPFYPSLSPSPHLNLPTPHPNHLAHILTTPAPYTPSPSFSTPRYSSRSPPLSLTPHPLYPLTILLHTSLLLRLTTPFPHPSPLTPYTPSPSPHQSSPILTTPHHSSPLLTTSPLLTRSWWWWPLCSPSSSTGSQSVQCCMFLWSTRLGGLRGREPASLPPSLGPVSSSWASSS